MNALWLLLVFVLCALVDGAPLFEDQKAYYWRHYAGTIPHDAVKGGKTFDDLPTYIGQVFFDGAIIPTEIRPNQTKVYFVWAGPKFVTENIKILCSQQREQLEWIKANEKNAQYLWSKHIIMAGFYPGEGKPFLIGRVSHQNKALIVGEARINDKEIRIWYTYDGAEFSFANEDIELLSYNPNLSAAASLNKYIEESKRSKSEGGCAEKTFNVQFN